MDTIARYKVAGDSFTMSAISARLCGPVAPERDGLKTVSTWLGHASAAFTLKVYVNWMGRDTDLIALARVNVSLSRTGGARVGRAEKAENAGTRE
jgi:hypothetical protein